MLYNLFCANIYINTGNENITKKTSFHRCTQLKTRKKSPSILRLIACYPQQRAEHILVKILRHTLSQIRYTKNNSNKKNNNRNIKKIQQLSIFGRHKTGPTFIKILRGHSHADGTPFSQFRNKTF